MQKFFSTSEPDGSFLASLDGMSHEATLQTGYAIGEGESHIAQTGKA
jgi:hypothetical protein